MKALGSGKGQGMCSGTGQGQARGLAGTSGSAGVAGWARQPRRLWWWQAQSLGWVCVEQKRLP